MIAAKGGASEPPNMRLPGKAGGTVAVRRTLASTICRIIPIRRRFLDRGSSATHQRSCGSDPRIIRQATVVSTTAPPALPGRAKNKRLLASHQFTRLHLAKADMRVVRIIH